MKKFRTQQGLTFDDVLLVPNYSVVLPREVSTKTRLTCEIYLSTPLLSAAMDTVTEAPMAIALACHGGLGVIHKNMSPPAQANEVRKVKRWRNSFITDPVTLLDTDTMEQAIIIKNQQTFTGFPVVDKNKRLVGLITSINFDLLEDPTQLVKDAMTPLAELTVGEKLLTLKEAHALLRANRISKLPLVDEEGKLYALVTLKDIKKTKDYPQATIDQKGQLRVGAAIGVGDDMQERIDLLIEAGVDVLFVDTAHGHSQGVLQAVAAIRKQYPYVAIVAGNIATAEAALALRDAGVDGVKVGIGPGSICTTRIVSGVGVPQITAIYDVAQALIHSPQISIIADGGIRQTGDLVKAIAAGADCIMAGSLFAGTNESPGETILFEGKKYKSYRGMGSLGAMEDGSKDRYFQSNVPTKKLVPEGIEGVVPYKGSVTEIIEQYVGGLRSGMGYCGAKDIDALKQVSFIQITGPGLSESHPHNIIITKDAPNYRSK